MLVYFLIEKQLKKFVHQAYGGSDNASRSVCKRHESWILAGL